MPTLPSPTRPPLHRSAGLTLPVLVLALGACGQPDPTALKRLACEQAGANLDLQSLSQLDALRKALGLAPSVDPIGYCRSIGARLEPAQAAPAAEADPAADGP